MPVGLRHAHFLHKLEFRLTLRNTAIYKVPVFYFVAGGGIRVAPTHLVSS